MNLSPGDKQLYALPLWDFSLQIVKFMPKGIGGGGGNLRPVFYLPPAARSLVTERRKGKDPPLRAVRLCRT